MSTILALLGSLFSANGLGAVKDIFDKLWALFKKTPIEQEQDNTASAQKELQDLKKTGRPDA